MANTYKNSTVGGFRCLNVRCGIDLDPPIHPGEVSVTCPYCLYEQVAYVFPALYTKPEVKLPTPAEAGDGTCFFHDQYAASDACIDCGRFVCTLCNMDYEGNCLCPECLQVKVLPSKDKAKRKLRGKALAPNQRRCPDRTAVNLGFLPLLVFPLAVYVSWITGPLAVFYGLRGLVSSPSVVKSPKRRAIFGILGGLMQIGLFVLLVCVLLGVY